MGTDCVVPIVSCLGRIKNMTRWGAFDILLIRADVSQLGVIKQSRK